jgi:hypothetical protein
MSNARIRHSRDRGFRRRLSHDHARDNIVIDGVIGLGVDAASGAMNSYAPEIQVVMAPIAGCRVPAPPSARR